MAARHPSEMSQRETEESKFLQDAGSRNRSGREFVGDLVVMREEKKLWIRPSERGRRVQDGRRTFLERSPPRPRYFSQPASRDWQARAALSCACSPYRQPIPTAHTHQQSTTHTYALHQPAPTCISLHQRQYVLEIQPQYSLLIPPILVRRALLSTNETITLIITKPSRHNENTTDPAARPRSQLCYTCPTWYF
ncbi:hypothetical protein K432DRAFT_393968 [Lepidopterella palustris CBS 459.81]|uniref:Uncharacterized protein n=1 Tax=Lepidopterella palustris CBS 459.81 TaxID=1314670 RepID=A0A8E2JEF8_9PEZI|nr:hypothetical protein K432DRAFT_393968 [Lepidopterella palustris CBS 459.81]